MMKGLLLIGAILFLLVGHFFKIIRWEKFIKVYERPPVGVLLKALSLSYALNFFLPFRLGDVFRAIYSGKRMKNGVGFAFATIILDRFLDIVAVAIIFMIFNMIGIRNVVINESTVFYTSLTIIIVVGFLFLRFAGIYVKKFALGVCSIFNDGIKLNGMKFCWSLINTFRDLWKLNILSILGSTALMWAGYMLSYMLFAIYLSQTGNYFGIVEVFTMLFSRGSLEVNSIGITSIVGDLFSKQQLAMGVYMVLPIAVMYTATLLPDTLRNKAGKKVFLSQSEDVADYLNILPQVDLRDQLRFLDDYFNSRNREAIKKFVDMNRNISIIRDYSAGSNATTMLCMNKDETFYRKYAFGEDGQKLFEQLQWLQRHSDNIPLCEIRHNDYGDGYCCYDMPYDSNAIGMFRYMHSHPIDDSKNILGAVLDVMRERLYILNVKCADEKTIEQYISDKVDANLNKLNDSKQIKELLNWETLVINGKTYTNLPTLSGLLTHDHLKKVFKNDRYSDIHGDLTIENIICLNDQNDFRRAYYIIDPNTGNIHNSQFLDFAKLLQSLHGGYEFMMMTKSVSIKKNHIDFIYTRSSAYDEMFDYLKKYLHERFTADEVCSIFHHEIIHWLRLMPYKLRNDKKRAAMFYAGLVMVMNDVEEWFD